MFRFDLKQVREGQETTLLVVDLIMLALLLVNLAWIIFDWLFVTDWFSGLVAGISTTFADYYATRIHPRFWAYDLVFVAIFLTEFSVRWVISVRRGSYLRWYFYPFIHWYELLGCIPLVGFRMLRFLRIFSMLVRLNRLGVIQLRETAVGRFLGTYYNVLIEELSDRVVLNVLDGVQAELRSGQPVTRRIVDEVVLARRDELVEQLGRRVEEILRSHYDINRQGIHDYVERRIGHAVEHSEDVDRLSKIPVFGGYASRVLERSVTQIVQAVIDGAAEDMESVENRKVIEEIVGAAIDVTLDQGDEFHRVTNRMLIDALEIVKERVRVQRWREQFDHGAAAEEQALREP